MASYRTITCRNCNTEKRQSTSSLGLYCSNKCQQELALKQRIDDWKSGKDIKLRNHSLKSMLKYLFGYSCSSCGINEWMSKPIALEVEHIDGNSENNSFGNVCLICPNCHSQTRTYKGANKGNGRFFRRQRYLNGKSY